jgi:hypothetical protein
MNHTCVAHHRMSFPRLRLILLLTAMMLAGAHGVAEAIFTKTDEIHLTTDGSHHGLAFDGADWHIGNPFTDTIRTYDAAFNYLSTIVVPGVQDMRGIAFDSNSGHLFAGDDSTNVVREITLSGTQVNQFSGAGISSSLNALAYDSRDDTIWLAYFSGLIEKRARTGTLINSFSKIPNWTGLAIDKRSNSLLALEDNDTLFEYRFDGTLIGQIIATDQIFENGQGLAYDSNIGRLYATTQIPGVVTVFDDPSRVPEPPTVVFAGMAIVAAIGIRTRTNRTSYRAHANT